uniref:Uncharacterized protein n=1 Tax=Solanum lycopersicum TaxID=4081 RepID=A0A3Q7HHU4_SOLLC
MLFSCLSLLGSLIGWKNCTLSENLTLFSVFSLVRFFELCPNFVFFIFLILASSICLSSVSSMAETSP